MREEIKELKGEGRRSKGEKKILDRERRNERNKEVEKGGREWEGEMNEVEREAE